MFKSCKRGVYESSFLQLEASGQQILFGLKRKNGSRILLVTDVTGKGKIAGGEGETKNVRI